MHVVGVGVAVVVAASAVVVTLYHVTCFVTLYHVTCFRQVVYQQSDEQSGPGTLYKDYILGPIHTSPRGIVRSNTKKLNEHGNNNGLSYIGFLNNYSKVRL